MAIMLLVVFFLFIALCFFLVHRHNSTTTKNLPPGSFGWPFIGETLAFIRSRRGGTPERFTKERIEKYGSPLVFKTSLLGERMAVFCGAEGNKFLFGNENKLVASWWPNAIRILFESKIVLSSEGKKVGFQPTSLLMVNNWASNPLTEELYCRKKLSSGAHISIYELHIPDFSANDSSVYPEARGGYLAFTSEESASVHHLKKMSDAGLTHIHLLPTFQFGNVEDEKEKCKLITKVGA
ncbi:beta-amyrin 28-oxidase-like protein [Tanacetum coccineum]